MPRAVHEGAFFSAVSVMSTPCLFNSFAMQSVLLCTWCGDSLLFNRLAHSGTPVLLPMVMLCSTWRGIIIIDGVTFNYPLFVSRMLTCDAYGVHSVDFRALNGGISGILCGDDDSAIIVLLSKTEAVAAGIA